MPFHRIRPTEIHWQEFSPVSWGIGLLSGLILGVWVSVLVANLVRSCS